MSVTQAAVETIHSHDLSPCLDNGRGLHSENGELYCEQTIGGGDTFSDGGWPSPPTPTQPKPAYPPLTQATAGLWVKTAVEYHFRYIPKQFRATHCVHRAARFRCNVSWRHGAYSFAGTAEVGDANVYNVTYTYGPSCYMERRTSLRAVRGQRVMREILLISRARMGTGGFEPPTSRV